MSSSVSDPNRTSATQTHRPRGNYDDALIDKLVEEMIRRWQEGDQVKTEEFLNRHSELWGEPEAAIELVYEEICLRKNEGQADFAMPVLERFPQWRKRLEVMLVCHCLLETPPPQFPQVGETIAGYHLLQQLGRGASGRVFLASQSDLADRPVVVKFTAHRGEDHEYLNLARLQHTHIVPLFAAHVDPVRHIRLICMPYFGGVTLECLLHSLAGCPLEQCSEKLKQALLKSGIGVSGPIEPILSRLSYVQGICWIGACLADALAYAHAGGLLHLDVKASNVLIGGDGQPMLLDFHLAQAPIQPGGPVPEFLGGTPGYMAPEQHDAMQAIKLGKPLAEAVDQRADVYALGAVLYEALGGTLPYHAGTSPPLRRINPQVSQGVSDIVGKCLAQLPRDRYATATALATDLRCHLTNQPLLGVRNRSWSERFQKWQRRSPTLLRNWTLLLLLVGTMGALAYGTFSHWKNLSDDVAFALTEGRKNWRERQRYGEAIAQLKQGLELARSLPLQGTKELELTEEIRQAELAQALDQRHRMLGRLHRLAEQVRADFDIEHLPKNRVDSLNQSCQEFWAKRQLLKVWADAVDSDEAAHDLLDLVLFATGLQVRLARDDEQVEARRKALATLHEAESLFGPSVVLDEARRQHREVLNLPMIPARAPPQARTMWEHFTLGRAALLAGETSVAANHFNRALELQPHAFWPNYYQGRCDYQQGRYAESVAVLSVCIGAAPEIAGSYFNRALAYTALQKDDLALRDYTRVLQLDPAFANAAMNRGMLHFRAKRSAEAEADLEQAIKLGAPPSQAYYNLALVQSAQRNTSAALQSLDKVLAVAPDHLEARELRKQLGKKQ